MMLHMNTNEFLEETKTGQKISEYHDGATAKIASPCCAGYAKTCNLDRETREGLAP